MYGQQRSALAIDTDNVRLRRKAVTHMSDITQIEQAATGLERQVIEFFGIGHAGVELDVIFDGADFL